MRFFQPKPTKNDPEALANLILAACEDESLRKQIQAILQLDSFNRQSFLGSYLSQMKLQGAPAPLLEALTALQEDTVAQKTLELLADASNLSSNK